MIIKLLASCSQVSTTDKSSVLVKTVVHRSNGYDIYTTESELYNNIGNSIPVRGQIEGKNRTIW